MTAQRNKGNGDVLNKTTYRHSLTWQCYVAILGIADQNANRPYKVLCWEKLIEKPCGVRMLRLLWGTGILVYHFSPASLWEGIIDSFQRLTLSWSRSATRGLSIAFLSEEKVWLSCGDRIEWCVLLTWAQPSASVPRKWQSLLQVRLEGMAKSSSGPCLSADEWLTFS